MAKLEKRDTQPVQPTDDSSLSEMMLETLQKGERLTEEAQERVPGISRMNKEQLKELALKLGEQRDHLAVKVGAKEEREQQLLAQLEMLQRELAEKDRKLEEKDQELEAKDRELDKKNREIDSAHADNALLQVEVDDAKREAKIALKNAKEADLRATHDPLTGLLNRRGGDEELDKRFTFLAQRLKQLREGGQERKRHMGVMMVDIDHFKHINDTYGHGPGDQVLRIVGQTIKRALRGADDMVIRYGGEEFMVVIPFPEAGDAEEGGTVRAIAKRIREQIEAEPIEVNGVRIPVTVSVGWDEWSDDAEVAEQFEDDAPQEERAARIQESLDEVYRRSDLALYLSKLEGRNTVNKYYEGIEEDIKRLRAEQGEPEE